MGRDNHLDTFTPKKPLARRHLYLQKSLQERYFLLSFLSRLKYPKQRDIKRAPTSLNAMVGPWNNSVNRFRFRPLPLGNQSRAYQQFLLVWSEFHHLQTDEWLERLFIDKFSIESKKSCGKWRYRFGKYNPLSLANPCITAS
jgi:hypothetical protein